MLHSETEDRLDQLIRVLPDVLANKIAAGEVVERPASVVKELVENAIDAGASRIEINLTSSGSDLIQVIDDGCGMGPADALLAFRRHATSKIRSVEDLERVRTLGFRGEAVASIAAVSRTTLRSKRRGDTAGIEIQVNGGEVASQDPVAAADGTIMTVRNLFYNVPARRKFLKAPATELRRVIETVEALALSHPDLSFELAHDGRKLVDVVAGRPDSQSDPLKDRIMELLGLRDDKDLISFSERSSYLSVTGIVGRRPLNRRSRGRQYLFVNGRSIRSRYLEHAVRSACERNLSEGEYPFYVLFLDLDPEHVDVNVHPTKAEVKFDDERGVYSVVRAVIARATSMADAAPLEDDLANAPVPNWRFESPQDRNPSADLSMRKVTQSAGELSELLYSEEQETSSTGTAEADSLFINRDRQNQLEIWQVDNAVLVVQLRRGLLLVDQNAAHERVLYERALDSFAGGGGFSQQLLFPQTIELSASEYALVESILQDLRALGFDADPFGDRTLLLRGVPTGVKEGVAESLLNDIIAQYREFHSGSADTLELRRDDLARSLARKSAVRRGEAMNSTEMRALVDQLLTCDNPWQGPAGEVAARVVSAEQLLVLFR
ncbi:MAG: DNA mismatch repair endonuclease MutL [Bacteroidetes bacterium]|nr:DNA mismatch repair endonuclease MutL [Bacteroidota bacterium]